MAKISLRDYIREIEGLIDRGETQKAIAHCKHLLRFYPKHIDTYRLFGKALLEMQKYGDASDIFQRVLSSVPDDFISQIGMSIIKEDENNLDAAIWHLERAFEIQPSNKAVQDELKRLYSSRDGVVPTKIRLTRGALVRMYARGELYAQAIAEIKASLLEDPNRVDLEVILARLYYMQQQKMEAAETASKLISKLPFCYEANRILAEILPGTSRDEDALIFKQRVIDLDPYFEFVTESIPNPIDIADDKVQVEYLDWDPSEDESEQPDWAKSIGLDWDSPQKSSVSQFDSWLNSELDLSKKEEMPPVENEDVTIPAGGFSPVEITQEPSSEEKDQEIFEEKVDEPEPESEHEPEIIKIENKEEIPSWMADVGWEVSDQVNLESEKGFNLEISDEKPSQPESSETIEPGIIPEWVKSLAPKEDLISEGIIDSDENFIEDRNFEKLFSPTAEDKIETNFFENLSPAKDWMKEFDNEVEEPHSEAEIDESADLPLPASDLYTESVELDENEPAYAATESVEEISEISDIPEDNLASETNWFKDLLPVEESDEIVKESEDFLSSLPDLSDSEQQPEKIEEEVENQNDFSWLNALQSNLDDGEEETPLSEQEEGQPESIFQDQLENETNQPSLDDTLSDVDFGEILKISALEDKTEIEVNKMNLEEKTPEWVEDLINEIPETHLEEPVLEHTEETVSQIDNLPDFIGESQVEDGTSEEIDSAFAWMESLSAKHSTREMPAMSELDNENSEPPEWIKEFQDEGAGSEEELSLEEPSGSSKDWMEDDLTPSWLKALQDETPTNELIESDSEKVSFEEFSKSADFPVEMGQVIEETPFIAEESVLEFEKVGEAEPSIEDLSVENESTADEMTIPTPVEEEEMLVSEEVNPQGNEDIVRDDLLEEEIALSSTFFETIEPAEQESSESENVSSAPLESDNEDLILANQALQKGKIEEAVSLYTNLIHDNQAVDTIIEQLKESLNHHYPVDISLWLTLGDAYRQKNQLQHALDAYTQAEELLT